jgi:histone chaperone ASF1
VYVGSAEDSSQDQVLEEVMVGPVPVGTNRFVLQSSAPNPALIANEDLLGVTVILITCHYMENKFVQIGYYVNNEYTEEFDPENPPNPVDINKLVRNIASDQPRVTRYPIDWNGSGSQFPIEATSAATGTNELDDDVVDLEDETALNEDDDEDDDEEEDIEGDVDLGDEDEEVEEGEEDDDNEEEGGDELVSDENNFGNMEVLNDDSNSMDVNRMFQQGH